ncbi:hypothetical protein [Nocardia asiatica]
MSDQSVTADQLVGIVRGVADEMAAALRIESFADSMDAILRPLCEDIALGYAAFQRT